MQTYAQMERGILFVMKTGSWGFLGEGESSPENHQNQFAYPDPCAQELQQASFG